MEMNLAALSAGLAETVERAGRLAVGIEGRPRIGSSGVLWGPGTIVTADHTIRRDEDIPVILPDGTTVRAELAGRDPRSDLAVLRVDSQAAPEFERRNGLRAGEILLSVGRHEPGVLAAMGIVSTAGGPWRTWRGGRIESLLRLDIGAYPRSSGSVLVDVEGKVAGILTSGLTRTAPVAIPAVTIDRIAAELMEHGRIAHGYLGIGLQPVALPASVAETLGREQQAGVIILSVEPGGPAEASGLMLGDVLVELGGREIGDTDDIQGVLEGQVGKQLLAIVLRGGAQAQVSVTVGERRS